MKYAYKGVAAILAIAVIIIGICTPLVTITIDSPIGSILGIIGYYKQNEEVMELVEEYKGKVPSSIGADFAISDLVSPSENSIMTIINAFAGNEEVSEKTFEVIKPALPAAITFLVVFALILICALAIIVAAFACKNNRIVMYLSITGCGLTMMLLKTFKDLARIFVEGDITLADIVGNELVSLVGSISDLEVPSTMWFIAVVFVAIIIWTVLYNITLPEKEKIERKRMLGEAD
jgi:hypothetical protein